MHSFASSSSSFSRRFLFSHQVLITKKFDPLTTGTSSEKCNPSSNFHGYLVLRGQGSPGFSCPLIYFLSSFLQDRRLFVLPSLTHSFLVLELDVIQSTLLLLISLCVSSSYSRTVLVLLLRPFFSSVPVEIILLNNIEFWGKFFPSFLSRCWPSEQLVMCTFLWKTFSFRHHINLLPRILNLTSRRQSPSRVTTLRTVLELFLSSWNPDHFDTVVIGKQLKGN